MITNPLFTYDDICLRPKYSELSSRSKADTSVEFLGKRYKLPVIPANMKDVISWNIAYDLAAQGYFYVMHRFDDANYKIPPFSQEINISLGVTDASKDEFNHVLSHDHNVNSVTIDVAHGHHKLVKEMVAWIKSTHPETKIIAGNIATLDGYKFLCDLGVDAVKVGIGGGSICSTRYKTGFHLPTATSIWECAINGGLDVPIIADGGATHFGDVAKALTLGATMVMSGRWFAECIDSPAAIHNGKKIYRGSTSAEAKGHNKHIEGHTLEIAEGCTYIERLEELKQAIQSSISYAGGTDLDCFTFVKFDFLRR